MKQREEWNSRIGFILAAVGSAVGLGNIWRFPYQLYNNRGGLFLIPYFFALLTAGIPILILEFGIGHKFRGAAPTVFARISKVKKGKKSWEALGWFQTLISFGISTYYSVIVGWIIGYFFLAIFSSPTSGWGSNTAAFFNNFLGATGEHIDLIHFNSWIPLLSLFVWLFIFIVENSGIKKGIEKASKFFMPILIFLLFFITLFAVSLKGSGSGLNHLFYPDFSNLTLKEFISICIAAYGQIFYSLSVCFAIMICYSSYLPKKSDIVNNAFITGLLDCAFSLLSAIMVFSILGNMAYQNGVTIDKVATQGVGLAFITIPNALNAMTAPWGQIIGPLFFLSLFFAGISSAISVVETTIIAFMDKFHLSRLKVTTFITIIGFTISLLFCSRLGVEALSVTDSFINNVGILLSGIIEIILLAWFFDVRSIQEHVNLYSDFKARGWWRFFITFVAPISLIVLVAFNLISTIHSKYNLFKEVASNYFSNLNKTQTLLTIFFGYFVIILIATLSKILEVKKGSEAHNSIDLIHKGSSENLGEQNE